MRSPSWKKIIKIGPIVSDKSRARNLGKKNKKKKKQYKNYKVFSWKRKTLIAYK